MVHINYVKAAKCLFLVFLGIFGSVGGKIQVYLLTKMFNEKWLQFLHCTYEAQSDFNMVVMEEHTMLLDSKKKNSEVL